jgi:hypothetical protein
VDVDGKSIWSRSEQEFAATCGFEHRALAVAEVKGALQLGGFARPLSTKEDEGGVGGHDRARF